jgi:peptidoglycan/LPS O-acetylase OafA/YrhL
MNPTKDQRRYHALDGLRAGMMLLGIVFHAALPYTTLPRWPFKDSSTHPVFDVLTVFLHIFRVPIFFAMAGFSLLCCGSGTEREHSLGTACAGLPCHSSSVGSFYAH